MEFIPVVAMAALTLKIVDFIRYASAADTNGLVTQLAAWLAGTIVVMLVAHTSWASGISIGDTNLGALGFWSQVFYGVSSGSIGSALNDARSAVDNNNTAVIPTLLPGRHRRVKDVA